MSKKRRKAILEYIIAHGFASADELAEHVDFLSRSGEISHFWKRRRKFVESMGGPFRETLRNLRRISPVVYNIMQKKRKKLPNLLCHLSNRMINCF